MSARPPGSTLARTPVGDVFGLMRRQTASVATATDDSRHGRRRPTGQGLCHQVIRRRAAPPPPTPRGAPPGGGRPPPGGGPRPGG